MICELSGMDVANASLLDEGSSAAEVMTMCYSYHKARRNKFFVSDTLHPQTLKVLETRAYALEMDLKMQR